jgi:hypothetical protein
MFSGKLHCTDTDSCSTKKLTVTFSPDGISKWNDDNIFQLLPFCSDRVKKIVSFFDRIFSFLERVYGEKNCDFHFETSFFIAKVTLDRQTT